MVGIKETISKHSVSLDQRKWRQPMLNPGILNKFLRRLLKDDDTPVVIGKKRHAENTDTHDGPSKRQKFTDVTNGTGAQMRGGERSDVKIPAFKHAYDLTFTLSPPDPDNGGIYVTEVYRKEVEVLKKTLSLCSQSPVISDRGDILLPTTITNYPPDEHLRCTLDVYLPGFQVPLLSFCADHAPRPSGSGDRPPLDPIGAAHLLGTHHGVELTFSVRLWPTLGPEYSPEHVLPLKISIDMEGFLLFPKITHAPKNVVRRSYGDAWNTLVKHLFPPPPATFPNYRGETDIAFLYSILEPAPSLPSRISSVDVQPKALLPDLLPFQRRSVMWMLQREGKTLDGKGQVVEFVPDYRPLFWEDTELGGQTMYLNRVRETLSLEPPPPDVEHPGGSLNEAPGLGKTVECMALILLNPDVRRNPSVKRWDAEAKVHVREVHTTLIITPATLASQWQDELKRHAPSLKVFFYEGWSKFNSMRSKTTTTTSRSRSTRSAAATRGGSRARFDGDETPAPEDNNEEWCSYINEYDVCITTYTVLTNDLHVARPPAKRPRRDGVSYLNIVRQRSPLVTCEWYRVIMDEVQMVGGGKTEEMVSLIPRLSSFAVSGTPARSQVPDLIHVLKFLRVEGVSATIWSKLQRPEFVGDFMSLFRRLAVRTTKSMVRDELGIPEQTRYLVPIDLGRVEKHFYDQHMERALLALGFDARGVTVDERLLDPVLLRSWIRKLRGICTHPQVGQLQNSAEKKGTFKSIEEVLDSMRETNWKSYAEERRSRINHLTVYAQLQQRNEEDLARYQHTLETLLTAEVEANALIEDLKVALESLNSQAKSDSLEQDTSDDNTKGKGKERESSPDSSVSEDDDAGKRGGITNRLREAELLLHKVTFLMGDVYHTLGAKYSKEEEEAYAKAELIRRKLLKVAEENTVRAIAVMAEQTGGLDVDELILPENYLREYKDSVSPQEKEEDPEEMEVDELTDETEEDTLESDEGSDYDNEGKGEGKAREKVKKPAKPTGGKKTKPKKKSKPAGQTLNELIREANIMITDLLNAQTNLLWQWRGRLVELLTRSISSESGEDADGKEYARSLETQGEAETFLHAYSVLLNDRREALFAEKSLLAAHDGRGTFKRATAAAMRALDRVADAGVEMMHVLAETRPEDQILRRDLMEERLALVYPFQGRALKSIMVDLTGFASNHGKKLKAVATDAASLLRDLISSQMKHNDKLDADLAHFRRSFNERVVYFRQLQEISDSVVEAEWEGSLADAVVESKETVDSLGVKINSLQSHQRYLDNLSGMNATGEEDDTCIVCRCEFLTGFVTRCAHVFCEDCLKAWLSRKEGKVCPVCRVPINQDQLQKFRIKDNASDPAPSQKARFEEQAPKSRRVIEYNNINSDLFKAIGEVQCFGSYGTKIEMLIRHLLYLQKHEPDAKSIVFSAWADSLHIIDHALKSNGIPSIKIDKGGKGSAAKSFDQDPELRVMLLHGERENAGLNIVCASRVFLLESVVNHAFEVQAIARIDRLSQTRSTQVFCYYAKDTIEKNILDLAARQGLSLYTKENSAGNLTNVALAATTRGKSGQKGDFISSAEDMLAILFPHLFEDLEFLVPPEVMMDETVVVDVTEGVSQIHVNAEAGPSRLR